MEETKGIFIIGLTISVSNRRVIGNITKRMMMRVVLRPVTCDHPAQCATGKLLDEGKAGCRRCHLVGIHSKNTNNHRMYNGNNRYHVRYPTVKWKLTES